MKEKYGAQSMLKAGRKADEQYVFALIQDAGRNLRAMCRAMQVYSEHTGVWLKDSEEDMVEMKAIFEMFYEFVDHQVDGLTEVSAALETDLEWFSMDDLRNSEEFRRSNEPLPPEAFISKEGYLSYCADKGITPAFQSDQNCATGD